MGLFDELLRSAIGSQATDPYKQSNNLVESLVSMLQDPRTGGIEGLAGLFEQRGMGEQAQSWIGTGANRSITPDQLSEALGPQRVQSLSSSVGLGTSAGAAAIAALLPVLIDKLTPDGRAPQTSSLGGLLEGLLGGGRPGRAQAAPPAARPDFSNVQSGSSSAPVRPPEQIYTVAPGDSLSKIAKRCYGDASQWQRIFEANRDQISNPDLIHPGQKLKIPS